MARRYRSCLLLIADDWSRLAGCYSSPVIRTPNIDRLAGQGVVFDNAFCTSPSCAVSRACILTGLHSHTHGQYGHCQGIHGFRTHEHVHSLPAHLAEHGYRTACLGKKHVAPESVYPFDTQPPVAATDLTGLATAARVFLADAAGAPFYLHVGFSVPHRVGTGFGNETDHGVPAVEYSPEQVVVPAFLPDLPEVRQDLAEYYRAVSRLDSGIGLLLQALEESGRAEETLVIVTTDHAMPFPGAKASCFDSGHHCPLIVRAPDQPAGKRCQGLVAWTAFRPTIEQWCGVPASPDLPDRSFMPLLADPGLPGWDEVFFSHNFHEVIDYNPYRAVRGRRYKYVRNLAADHMPLLPTDLYRSPTWTAVRKGGVAAMGVRSVAHVRRREPEELYDLVNDPWETTNLLQPPRNGGAWGSPPAVADEVAGMRRRLSEFRHATADPWLEVDTQEQRGSR